MKIQTKTNQVNMAIGSTAYFIFGVSLGLILAPAIEGWVFLLGI